jgi:surface antigen
VYREPATVVYRTAPRDNECVQTREYTATVTIDGRQVEAWGTRCLRPDGTWSYGPVQIADQ